MPIMQEVKQGPQQETLPYARALLVGFCEDKRKRFTHNIPEHYILVVSSIHKARAEMKRNTKPIMVVLNAENFSVNEMRRFFKKKEVSGTEILVASSFGNSTTANGTAFIGIKEAVKKTREKILKHTPKL